MKLIFSIFVLVLGCLVLVMACMVAAGRADMKEEYLSIQNWRYCDDDCVHCKYGGSCRMSGVREDGSSRRRSIREEGEDGKPKH